MTNYLPWIITISLATVAFAIIFMRWYLGLRLQNLRVAGSHYQRLAELVGKIEGSSESSEESKKFVAWLADRVFDEKSMHRALMRHITRLGPSCTDRQAIDNLKEMASQLGVTSPESLRVLAAASFESKTIAILTWGFPFLGRILVAGSGKMLKELEEDLEQFVEAATCEIDWPKGNYSVHCVSGGEEASKKRSTGDKGRSRWPNNRLGSRLVSAPFLPANLDRQPASAM